MNNNLSFKFKLEVMIYKLSRNLKLLKFKIRDVYYKYNPYFYLRYLYNKHHVYDKIISSKYNFVYRFLVYLEFKGIINNDKHNQVNNNNDIEYIKNVMYSIITKYE